MFSLPTIVLAAPAAAASFHEDLLPQCPETDDIVGRLNSFYDAPDYYVKMGSDDGITQLRGLYEQQGSLTQACSRRKLADALGAPESRSVSATNQAARLQVLAADDWALAASLNSRLNLNTFAVKNCELALSLIDNALQYPDLNDSTLRMLGKTKSSLEDSLEAYRRLIK